MRRSSWSPDLRHPAHEGAAGAARPTRPGFTYVIVAHQHPDEVVRLGEAIQRRHPGAETVVAWNGPLEPAAADRFAAAGIARTGSGRPARWGSFDVTERILEAFSTIDPGRWVAVVSGDSYPTGDLAAWADDVVARGLDMVGRGRRVDDDPLVRARVDYVWVQWPRPSGRFGQWAFRAVGSAAARLGLRRRVRPTERTIAVGVRRRKDAPAVLGHGDTWMALAPEARRRVLELVARPEVAALYRTVHIPDEHLVQTIALAEGWTGLGVPLMLTVWPAPDAPHPRQLGPADLDVVADAEAPFARKVTGPEGVALVRLLDERFEHRQRAGDQEGASS